MSSLARSAPRRYLSLRWKALIGLSVVLVLINALLALFFYQRLTGQFERQQAALRVAQTDTLRALVEDGYQHLARLANVVPLLAPVRPDEDLAAHLQRAFAANGVMLDLEWDVRSADWVGADGRILPLWPPRAEPLLPKVAASVRAALDADPGETARLLNCAETCRQLLAAPQLWQGEAVGALLLGRSIADLLLAFHALTGAEVALVERIATPIVAPAPSAFKAITDPQRSRALFQRALRAAATGAAGTDAERAGPTVIAHRADWYELYGIGAIAPGIDAWVLNRVTAEQRLIRAATRQSIGLGVVGLLLSESLLLLIMNSPLRRVRDLADRLPLLAEGRFAELRTQLPRRRRHRLRDEIDLMVSTVRRLTSRMEESEHDREAARAELVWLADHDPLTRLLNRRRFDQELRRVVAECTAGDARGALLFLDLDQFKDVNDTSGHQLGDELLQRVAAALARTLPGDALLGRLGGDEFAIILPGADGAQATAIASRVREGVQAVVVQTRIWRHSISASIGIVLYPEHDRDAAQLLADADLAMYQAKEGGRGRWHLFSRQDKGRERANARVLWAERIAAALRDERFELLLQPILHIGSGRITRAEALIRMRDTDGALVSPFSFIPVAEETGQIQAIDHWVLANAIALLGRRGDLVLSANLSAHGLGDPTLCQALERLLSEHRVEPRRLTLEITETAAINSLESASQMMEGIRRLGCRFALDDFGTGFASYAYLRRLPVDAVKIDGAFIRNIVTSQEDQIFVRAVAEMAHSMDRQVIAEFVDKPEIVSVLAALGVDYAQGHLIGKPMAADVCARMPERWPQG